jgi:hypothetical protein
MSGLGKSVDDYPDGIKLAAGEGQTHNEIHTDVFSFQVGILKGYNNPAGHI